MKAYQLKIQIKDAKPPIWRRCVIPAGITFSQLTLILNEIMGWSGYHLSGYEFYHMGVYIEEKPEVELAWDSYDYIDASETLINDYLDNNEWFTYIYDFGDNWQHRVTIEKIYEVSENYPRVLKYKGKTPLEDCGGLYGYYGVLNILNNPEHEEYESYQDWLEETGVDPDAEYDMDAVNQRLEYCCYYIYGKQEKRSTQKLYLDYFDGKRGLHAVSDSKEQVVPFDAYQKTESGRIGNLGEKEELFQGLQEEDTEFFGIFRKMYEEMEEEASQYSDMTKCEVSLLEILNSLKREDLVYLAKIKGMRGYSKWNKAVLAENLAEYMLQPEEMYRYFSYLDEIETMYLMVRVVAGIFFHDEANVLGKLQGSGYLGCLDDGRYIVPSDVAEKLCENSFFLDGENKEQRITLMQYMKLAVRLYGIVPVDVFLKIYQQGTSEKLSELEIINMVEEVPQEMSIMRFYHDKLCHVALIEDYEEFLAAQADVPYYIPTTEEIQEFIAYEAFIDNKAFQQFVSFLDKTGDLSHEENVALGVLVQRCFACDLDIYGVLEEMEYMGVMPTGKQKTAQMKRQLQNMRNNTRMQLLRGFTPNEIAEKEDFALRKKRTAAENKVIDFSAIRTKKIYPNDKCPCGSGKKYKHCCGKGK